MNCIHLLPLGGVSPDLAGALPGPLRRAFRTGVEVREFSLDPEPFFDAGRGQYNSTGILMHIKSLYPAPGGDPGIRTLAVVPFDLYIPILTYVFGEAEVGGNVAVVSSYRLAPERYGLPPDNRLLAERLVKEVIHELGHVFSLIHCSMQACVMHSSSYVEDIDLKERSFCRDCSAELAKRS
ncbi:MAG TPA: archaemetzincin family Zn-dependent metalloprotease [Bacteroidota bacterium]|nr:archaemetzincin family Zn-dependent metalloprotease [Bacteroidota bacterium]